MGRPGTRRTKLGPKRTRRNEHTGEPPGLEGRRGRLLPGRILKHAGGGTNVLRTRALLLPCLPPPRHSPVRDLLHESQEAPQWERSQLSARPDQRGKTHDGGSSSIGASTIIENNTVGEIVSSLFPGPGPRCQIVGGFTRGVRDGPLSSAPTRVAPGPRCAPGLHHSRLDPVPSLGLPCFIRRTCMPPTAPPPSGRGSVAAPDGLRLYTQRWTPVQDATATVLLVHGYAEHCGRYDHVAEAFVKRGAAVYAYDQRGHGRSEGRRAYVDRFEQYLTDLRSVRAHVAARTPRRPLFLFGHSMGGLAGLLHALEHPDGLRGLLLSAPALEVNPDLGTWLRPVAQVVGRFFPTVPTVRGPDGAISRDPTVVEAADADPLNYHGRTLARTGAELLRAGRAARERLHELDTPFLVIHGTADPLATPAWSKRLYERAAAPDKTLRLYDGLYHETFNEPERAPVLRDLGAWLGARLP